MLWNSKGVCQVGVVKHPKHFKLLHSNIECLTFRTTKVQTFSLKFQIILHFFLNIFLLGITLPAKRIKTDNACAIHKNTTRLFSSWVR
jgi:hypothetical protein